MNKRIHARGLGALLTPGLLLASLLASLVGCRSEPQPGAERWAQLKQEIRTTFPDVQVWSVKDLKAVLDRGAQPLLLDVRTREEFDVSHLPGARWAPDLKAAKAILENSPEGATFVLYCSVGYRSARLAEELSQAGRVGLFNLEGSIFEWANAGLPVVRGQAEVREVHPYDNDWGELLERRLWSSLEKNADGDP